MWASSSSSRLRDQRVLAAGCTGLAERDGQVTTIAAVGPVLEGHVVGGPNLFGQDLHIPRHDTQGVLGAGLGFPGSRSSLRLRAARP